MLLFNSKLACIIESGSLPAFRAWLQETRGTPRHRVSAMIKLAIATRPAAADRVREYDRYSHHVPHLSWVWLGSDGTRVHLYDSRHAIVGKMAPDLSAGRIVRELEVRRQAGTLSPRIIDADPRYGLILEERIARRRGAATTGEHAVRALMGLREAFGDGVPDSLAHYLKAGLPPTPYTEAVEAMAARGGVTRVDVRYCHGDVWRGNLLVTPGDDVVLVDWEYCGLRVASFDAWFYVFSSWAGQRRPSDRALYLSLRSLLHQVHPAGLWTESIEVLHAVHLLERYATHLSLGKAENQPEMACLRRELEHTIAGVPT